MGVRLGDRRPEHEPRDSRPLAQEMPRGSGCCSRPAAPAALKEGPHIVALGFSKASTFWPRDSAWSSREARIELSLVLTAVREMPSMRGPESVLQSIAEADREGLGANKLVPFLAK